MKSIRLAVIGAVVLVISGVAYAECFGWRLVGQKQISITEKLCVYEKSGVQQKFIVENGFCPMSPPGC